MGRSLFLFVGFALRPVALAAAQFVEPLVMAGVEAPSLDQGADEMPAIFSANRWRCQVRPQ